MEINTITSRQILDSRGRSTLETMVELDTGDVGMAAVPSGASTGVHEAWELRDADGVGVRQAIAHVIGPIAKKLKGMDVRDQRAIDAAMLALDGTVNKSKLGGNAILSVSLAAMRANAAMQKQPLYQAIQATYDFPAPDPGRLPRPMMNIINGGKHADDGLVVQEFMIVPDGKTAAERIERGAAVYRALGKQLTAEHLSTLVGDEGGYAPHLKADVDAIEQLVMAIKSAGLKFPDDVAVAIDFASSTFFDPVTSRYRFNPQGKGLTALGMVGLLEEWLATYPILSFEDPLAEDDWTGWADLTAKLGSKVMLVGDDVFVSNRDRLERGVASKVANAVLLKPNQVGTLSETIDTIQAAQAAQYTIIVSHRSGETLDTFISDLAVGVGAPFLKAGAPARGERVAKYNRLLAIEQELAA